MLKNKPTSFISDCLVSIELWDAHFANTFSPLSSKKRYKRIKPAVYVWKHICLKFFYVVTLMTLIAEWL